ncbi:MAG TPA: PLP-dependent aspartate aminotransferase family protein [Terriglobia bacterium]|nr:PLP-dependent aspartate aminotransferase family protein [Terriglobia bacterium]
METRRRHQRKEDYRLRTHLIHGNFESRKWDYDHHVVPPVSQSTAFRLSSLERGARGFEQFASAAEQASGHQPIYIYDRLNEPTRGMLEENLAYAEGGEICVSYATGMAAVSAALGATLAQGQEALAHEILYGCTFSQMTNWLPRFGIKTRFADFFNPESLAGKITPATRVLYFETPINPTLQLIDIASVRAIANEANRHRTPENRLLVVVDNTFATPQCQRPLSLGADVVVESLTKGIGGFGTDMGGAVVTSSEWYHQLMLYRKDFGGVLNARSAWTVLVYGLPTLATRMTNMQKTAQRVGEFLCKHPKVSSVNYPGLDCFPQKAMAHRQMVSPEGKFAPGSMLYFVMRGEPGKPSKAEKLVNYLAEHAYSITLAVSLGQVKTLIEHPFSMTHSALPDEQKRAFGMHPEGIRLSIGLEDWHDIIRDLELALETI